MKWEEPVFTARSIDEVDLNGRASNSEENSNLGGKKNGS